MKNDKPLSRVILTVDIETFGGTKEPTREDVKVPGNYKKQDAIDRFVDEHLPEQWAKQALMSTRGEIVCIGLAFNDEDVEVLARSGSEEDLMRQFVTWLHDKGVDELVEVYWVCHNADFDLQWLLHRAWKYRLPLLVRKIPTRKYDTHVIDTMAIFPGSARDMYKLDSIAKFLGVPGKSEGFDATMVHPAYIAGRLDEIVLYCAQDVEVCRSIAQILKPEVW